MNLTPSSATPQVNIVSKLLLFSFALILTSVSCLKSPNKVDNRTNSNVSLVLKNASESNFAGDIIDSLGKNIEILVISQYPEHITSTHIQILNKANEIELDTTIHTVSKNVYDTTYITHTHTFSGQKKVITTTFFDNETFQSDTAPYTVLPSPSDSKVALRLQSSSGIQSEHLIYDTIGNDIQIFLEYMYPEFIKAISIKIVNKTDTIEFDTILIPIIAMSSDTIRFTHLLQKNYGEKKVIASAIIDDGSYRNDTVLCLVLASHSSYSGNKAPFFQIQGNKNVVAGELCTLSVTINDEPTQTHLTTVTNGENIDTVHSDTYIWQLPADAQDKDTLIFTTTDNGTPPLSYSDTVFVSITHAIPGAPTAPRIEARDEKTITLAWNESPGAESYQLLRSDNPTTGFAVIQEILKETKFTDNLTGQPQYYQVIAQNRAGSSAPSTVVAVEHMINSAPQWNITDTVRITLIKDTTYSLSLAERCVDPQGDPIIFSLLPDFFEGDTIDDTTYSCTPLAEGTFIAEIAATDPQGLSDTLRIKITVTAPVVNHPTITDKTPPKITLQMPENDRSIVSVPSVPIIVKCIDENGIGQVACFFGNTEVLVTDSAPGIYTAYITNLALGENTIFFTAADGSINANETALGFTIIYDPILDGDYTEPPVMILKNPKNSGERIYEDSITIQIKVTSPSGIASVTCTHAGNSVQVTNVDQTELFSATITGLAPGKKDTITFVATDQSPIANINRLDIEVQYNTPIGAITLTGPANEAVGIDVTPTLTWTGGDDPDGDTVYYKVRYGTKADTLSSETSETSKRAATINTADKLIPFTTYYWQVIAYSKVNNDSSTSEIRSFTTKGIAPVITKTDNLKDQTLNIGDTLTLAIEASGTPSPTFQWYHNDIPISGATSETYTKSMVEKDDRGIYHVVVSNGIAPDQTSSTVNITINKLLPIVITPPVAESINYGQLLANATLTGGQASVDGVFAFTTPTTVPSLGTTDYSVTFTPVDTSKYYSVPAGSLSVIVGPLIDADGNEYTTVVIGSKEWTVENLRTTKYQDGTPIPHVPDSAAWAALSTPGYCWYNNTTDAALWQKYGALYNWYTVETSKLSPQGWRVPTDADWQTLENYLIANGYNYDGTTTGNKIGKAMAITDFWGTSTEPGATGNNQSTNNKSGFSAIPGGNRWSESQFGNQGYYIGWWSATQNGTFDAWSYNLYYAVENLTRFNLHKNFGFSIRLVRDLN